MKKLIIFTLFLFVFSFAKESSILKTIENSEKYPNRNWYLSIKDQNEIKQSNLFQRIYYRLISFITSYHEKDLQKVLNHAIDSLQKTHISFLDAENKIAIEKFVALYNEKKQNFWFSQKTKEPLYLPWISNWQFVKENSIDIDGLMQPYRVDGRFFNDEKDSLTYVTSNEVYIFLKSLLLKSHKIHLKKLYKIDMPAPREKNLTVQWLGHSSFLIQSGNLNILTDPVTEAFHPLLGNFVKAFKRYTKFPIPLENLPKIDVIVISHNHLDHLEDKALNYFRRYQPLIIVPEGLKLYFVNRGFTNVMELSWWENVVAKDNHQNEVKIFSVPAVHNSMSRGEIKRQESLWCGYLISSNDKSVYFSGDTAYSKKMFDDIHRVFKKIDIALLPIAPNNMLDRHMDIRESLLAMENLNCKLMIPMHWGAYRTGDEKIEEPFIDIKNAKEANSYLTDRIKILKIGQKTWLKR